MHPGQFAVLAMTAVLALADPVPKIRHGALKQSYQITLRSEWPQWGAGSACVNGGEETLVGTLTANGEGEYGGTLRRRTRLLFCGAHGASAADRCDLTLEGDGAVTVSAEVLEDERSPSGRVARMLWIPEPGHTAAVTGTCSDSFKNAVQAMYLSARHSAEVPLTTVGSGPLRLRLEDYPWTVEVE
jgi:hypothetical protein